MGTRWWGLFGLAVCLLGAPGCAGGLHVGQPAPHTLTVLYSADLGGRLSAADGNGRNLSDVASRVDALRKEAAERGDTVVVVDTGHAFSGTGPLDTWQRGSAMAQGMKAVGYDAVLPDEHDIWGGRAQLARLQEAGGFQVLLANAPDVALQKPVVRTIGAARVAIHGMYAPPHVFTSDEEAPGPDLALQRTPDALLAAMRATPADVHVVVVGVRDPQALLDKLPPHTIVIPAAGAPTGPLDPRVAPSLDGPRQLGRVTVTVPPQGEPQITCAIDAIQAGTTHAGVEAAVRGARADFDKAFAGKYRDAAVKVLAYAEPQAAPDEAGSTIADVVADALAADVCVLSPGEALAVKGGVISEAALAKLVDPKAKVVLAWASGAEVQAWLEQAETPPMSGVAAWRDGQGRVVLALHDGRVLKEIPRLRVAVSTRLRRDGKEGGQSVLALVRTALYTRPYLGAAPPRWFSASGAKVPEVDALLGQGSELAAEHPREAETLWTQALYRKPDDETAKALLTAMQTATPDRFPSYLQVAAAASRAGQWRLAWNLLQMGRIAWPDAWAYPLAQARLVVLNGIPQSAGPLLEDATQLGAPPTEVALLTGVQRLMLGDAAAADASLTAALGEVDEADRTRYYALAGLARLRKGDARGALGLWTRPAAAQPVKPVSQAGTAGLEVARP